jgi:uncharacterized protein (DUF3084 family)
MILHDDKMSTISTIIASVFATMITILGYFLKGVHNDVNKNKEDVNNLKTELKEIQQDGKARIELLTQKVEYEIKEVGVELKAIKYQFSHDMKAIRENQQGLTEIFAKINKKLGDD